MPQSVIFQSDCLLSNRNCVVLQVDVEKVVELCFHLENFPRAGTLVVPVGANSFGSVVCLHDLQGRRLFLHGNVTCNRGLGVRVSNNFALK